MKKLFLIIILLVINVSVNAQQFNRTVSLNLLIERDTILQPFNGNPTTSIGLTGHITFTSELGVVRFVVSDNYDEKYMVYESYRLFENDSSFNFFQKCEESCFFEDYVPTRLIIQVQDAVVTLTSLELSNTHYNNAEYQRMAAATIADSIKLNSIQNYIRANGLIWLAEHTKLSNLSYASKTKIWGDNFKSYGFEYYAGGFYSLFGPENDRYGGSIDYTGDYVDNFDWRNRHGANNPSSAYYDQDMDGSGWLTPPRCQLGCWENGVFFCSPKNECLGEFREPGTCWAFGPTAQIEALANLYYNEHLDLDLSEQYLACAEAKMEDWHPDSAFSHFKNEGVPFEECWPYTASLDNCQSVCNEPVDRVSIPSNTILPSTNNPETIRQHLMQNGPMAAHSIPFHTWVHHCMLLIGWGTIDETSPLVSGLPQGSIPESWYGKTYWIYKNSYGNTASYNMFGGYSYLIHNYSNSDIGIAPACYLVTLPINVPGKNETDINCIDSDGDGYYYWGIGPKPHHCPPCPDEPDGDDSNPSLGPLNGKGQCTIIGTYNASFENGWENWVQDYFPNGVDQEDYDWWRHTGSTNHVNTGPQSAQDGDYYIYANGSFPGYTNNLVSIASPPIDFSQTGACKSVVDFYYHMKAFNYGNDEHNELYIRYKKHGSSSWVTRVVAKNNQGDEWQHETIFLPIDVEQIKFFASKGEGACDVALDNITIKSWIHSETPIVITDNTVWEESLTTNQDIVIENGGRLTIGESNGSNVRIKLHPEAKIIVKQGGRLILDHCVLTNACPDELWQGIEVWGTSNMYQNSTYHGYLELKNGTVIENAKCAVQLWRPNYWSTTGGIIHATDATFLNNALSIKAVTYSNYNPGTHHETSYNAYFKNCSFVVNSSYLGSETFNRHVDLSEVNGLTFSGCNFSADRNVDGVNQWCIGINAYDAGFSVNSYCSTTTQPCSEENHVHSIFTGFCSGIKASSDGRYPRSFIVRNAVFNKNDNGIHAIDTGFPTIVGNVFGIGGGDYCDYSYGVLLQNVSGFCIEENDFHSSSIAGSTKVGVAVYHSNGINDVYRNMFKGLSGGSLALGQNTNVNGLSPGGTVQGLTYTCNEFSSNVTDMMVLQRDGAGDIQAQQGSSAMPAGNTFSSSSFQIYNEGTHQIDYYYNSNELDETPDNSKLYRVNRQATTSTNICASHYGNNPVTKSPSEKAALESDYLNAYTNYQSLRSLYENRIDGGNTDAQVADISGATAADMWQLRAQLLGLSPYVSRHVLNAAADRDDVFSDPVLFEILAANPDELKNDSLISYLESKANPLPAYMVELLRQMASGTSARTALVAQMDRYGHDFTMAAGDIVRSNLGDSVSNPTELRQWLGNMNDIAADRMAVSSYLQEGDSANAFALANMLPALYGLQGDQLADHCDYMRLIQLYQALYSSGRTVFEMSAAERAMVGSIAENGAGVSQSMAEVLMEQVTGGCEGFCFYPGLPEAGDGGKGGRLYPDDAINKAVGLSTNVGPNPATTWTTVNYVLPGNGAKALLSLTNSIGVTVYSTELDGATGSKVIDLRGLASGIYVYTIRYEKYTETGKLVITK